MARDRMSRRELRDLKKRLRYMNAKLLARDFKSPAERAAIRAVFKWLSLNGTCAWPVGKHGHLTQNALNHRGKLRDGHTGVVVDRVTLDDAEKLFGEDT